MYLPKGLCGKGSLAASPERVVHRRVHQVALDNVAKPAVYIIIGICPVKATYD